MPKVTSTRSARSTTQTTLVKPTARTSKQSTPQMAELRATYTHLMRNRLPQLARARASADLEPRWPVSHSQGFERLILDAAVGGGVAPWESRVSAPAEANMSEVQFREAIELGERVLDGSVDLNELKHASERVHDSTDTTGDEATSTAAAAPSKKQEAAANWAQYTGALAPSTAQKAIPADLDAERARIASTPSLTPFRKHVLTLLTQVPRGQWTTYKALADAVGHTKPSLNAGGNASGRGCARAVGSAMRNNPFAPAVPCHRVLAADGKIGGFGGDWGEDGQFVSEKRRLLREEGVKFDGKGKVVGRPFTAFVAC